MARAERLAAGPTGKTRPRGVFSVMKGTGLASGAILMRMRPSLPDFFWIFLEPWAHNEPHGTLETHSAPQRMKTAPSWSGPSEQNQERRWSFQVGTPLLVHLWRYLSIVFLMAAFQSSRRWP
jgi:hypothetical protein